MGASSNFLDGLLGEFLDEIAARTPAPAGGSVAAVVAAMAASLVAMAARFSAEGWQKAEGIAIQAEALRGRVAPLARADAEAYGRVLEAFRLPKDAAPAARDEAIRRALGEATAIPLEIAAIAAEVAALAAEVAEHGNPNLRGDAAAAAGFAEAAARVSANLVAINLELDVDDERVLHGNALVAAASEAAQRALSAGREVPSRSSRPAR